MKRICRQHGISRWPSRKINKVNRSLSKLKRVIESVQGPDGTFSLTPLATSPLPVAVGSISWPSKLNACSPQNSTNSIPYEPHGIKIGSPTPGSGQVGVEDQLVGGLVFSQEQPLQNRLSPELHEASVRLKTGSGSREESAGSPTSHGSCQGSPANESTPAKERSVSPVHEQCIKAAGSPELMLQPVGEHCLLPAYSIPDLRITTELQEPFGGMLIEDAGSSKDLRNLCPSVADAVIDERIPESSWTNPQRQDIPPAQILATPTSTPAMAPFSARPEMKTITIKATYREDIIRFRISLNSGIVELKEEVAKRLKLEVGTFDIKYLDDDHEWVLIACDADLQECVDISRSSGSNIIRLSVHDVNGNLGSSCESNGEL